MMTTAASGSAVLGHGHEQEPVVSTPHGDQSILEGNTVAFANLATFTDAGFDNPANPNPAVPPNITDPLHESFTYDINWGDGRDAITGASDGRYQRRTRHAI